MEQERDVRENRHDRLRVGWGPDSCQCPEYYWKRLSVSGFGRIAARVCDGKPEPFINPRPWSIHRFVPRHPRPSLTTLPRLLLRCRLLTRPALFLLCFIVCSLIPPWQHSERELPGVTLSTTAPPPLPPPSPTTTTIITSILRSSQQHNESCVCWALYKAPSRTRTRLSCSVQAYLASALIL